MTRLASIALLSLVLATGAKAASFDCGKATTPVERLVCENAALSTLDSRLAAAYQAAQGRSANPAELRISQSNWLKHRDGCRAFACAQAAYLSRIEELENVAPPYENVVDAIDHTCIALAANFATTRSHCRVTASAQFGEIAGERFHYALYCLDEPPPDEGGRCEISGIGLFSVDATSHRVSRFHLRSSDTGNVFAAPTIVRARQGTLLDMPVAVPGTGNQNASELFVRQAGAWQAVDNKTWELELAGRLPDGLAVWKGIWPDLRAMSAETGLYRARDANCCPTGGSATLKLALDGTRLVLVSVSVNRSRSGRRSASALHN